MTFELFVLILSTIVYGIAGAVVVYYFARLIGELLSMIFMGK